MVNEQKKFSQARKLGLTTILIHSSLHSNLHEVLSAKFQNSKRKCNTWRFAHILKSVWSLRNQIASTKLKLIPHESVIWVSQQRQNRRTCLGLYSTIVSEHEYSFFIVKIQRNTDGLLSKLYFFFPDSFNNKVWVNLKSLIISFIYNINKLSLRRTNWRQSTNEHTAQYVY